MVTCTTSGSVNVLAGNTKQTQVGYSPKEKNINGGRGGAGGTWLEWEGEIWGGDDQDTRHTCTELSKRRSIKTTAAADTRIASQVAKAVLHVHRRRLEPHRGTVLSINSFQAERWQQTICIPRTSA